MHACTTLAVLERVVEEQADVRLLPAICDRAIVWDGSTRVAASAASAKASAMAEVRRRVGGWVCKGGRAW